MEVEEQLYTNLCKAVELLDGIDDMGTECSTQQSQIDQELSDWLHMIQHQDLDDTELIKVGKKIKELRIKREHYNNLWELLKIYNDERNRLIDKGNREFLMNKIRSKYKHFNQPYNNRVLTDEDVNDKLEIKRKKRTKVDGQEIIKLFNEGMSVKEIAKQLGCATITIYKHIKTGE